MVMRNLVTPKVVLSKLAIAVSLLTYREDKMESSKFCAGQVCTNLNPCRRRSIRVLHYGRRWYYQPQAIRSERSGLVECTAVWFLRGILRFHGFDHTSLEPMAGKPVSESSWYVGDVVVPKGTSGMIARIVGASKDPDSVKVQFANPSFAEAVGLARCEPLEVVRVKTTRLYHATVMGGVARASSLENAENDSSLSPNKEKTRSDVASLSRLERMDIDAMIKECRKSSDSLANLFDGGLPEAFLASLTVAERLMNNIEPPDDLSDRISSVGDLAVAIAEQLFGDPSSQSLSRSRVEKEDDSILVDSATREVDDSSRLRQRNRLTHRNRRLRLIRDASRRNDDELQDRRNMILSLVARTGRRSGSRYLNEERPVPPHLLGAASELFGESWDMAAALSGGVSSTTRRRNVASESESLSSPTRPKPDEGSATSFLDSLLRCRSDLALKQPGTGDHFSFIRQLVHSGLISDDVEWIKALVESQSEKTNRRIPAIMRSIVDEEGTPLLLLAIIQRCSTELISRLLDWGAPSREEEVLKAAETDQSASLRLLLKRSPLKAHDLDVDLYTQAVKDVFDESKLRQSALEKAMAEAAGTFMVDVLRRLLRLALCSRRLCSPKMESCGRVICEILVGNVLLSSVQESERHSDGQQTTESRGDFSSGGLLGVLPRSVLFDCLLADPTDVTGYLLVCEEYMCSKELPDIASGLTLVHVLLQAFPELSQSRLVRRFGLHGFVADHIALANRRIASILAKHACTDKDQKTPKKVLCPKNHVAVLHITRHSSFRCDLCGNGVDRGRPMHGCRQCDWDACEKCTDASETGLVKCGALKDLASVCQSLLLSVGNGSPMDEGGNANDVVSSSPRNELLTVVERLKQRDVSAISGLSELLLDPGSVTIHEFSSIVLPALHASFVGQSKEASSGHQNKKAKVSELGESLPDDRHDILMFCQRSLLELTTDRGIDVASSGSHDGHDTEYEKETEYNIRDVSGEPQASKIDISYSPGISELLRRLHQVLSFHERLTETSMTSAHSGELQSLKKPLELHLAPSTFNSVCSLSTRTRSVLHVEPLVPVSDLQRHILQTYRICDSDYLRYCKR